LLIFFKGTGEQIILAHTSSRRTLMFKIIASDTVGELSHQVLEPLGFEHIERKWV
jgi:hypothetical protein